MVFFGRIINDGDKNDPDANVKVMGRGRYIYILAGVFALYFMLLFAPQFRFDGLIYLETARSMVFDHDLNTYNEKHFFSDPGWNGLAGRLLFEKRFRFIHFMQIPGYTEPGYQFTFFPFGNTIFWLPVMAAIKQFLMIFPVHSSAFINNGYSRVFQMGFAFWNILFVAAGLRIAYSVMIRFFPDRLAIVSLLIVLGSGNLLPFTFIDPTFSHGLDFFLINLLLFVLYKIQDNCGRQYDFIAGLLFGWLITVRYQEVFLVLLPATIYIWKLIRKDTRVAAFKQSGLFAAGSLVMIGLQMIYWQVVFGAALLRPLDMGTAGIPTLSLRNSELIPMLFSSFHGQFSWMPLQAVGFIGLLFFAFKNRGIERILLVVFLIEMVYNSCRTEWWNLGYGVRRFSGLQMIFAVGYAQFASVLARIKLRWFLHLFGIIAVIWNLLFIMLYYNSEFDPSRKAVLLPLTKVVDPYQPPVYRWVGPRWDHWPEMWSSAGYWLRHHSVPCRIFLDPKAKFDIHRIARVLLLSAAFLISSAMGFGLVRLIQYRRAFITILAFFLLYIASLYIAILIMAGSTSPVLALTGDSNPKNLVFRPVSIHRSSVFWGENRIFRSSQWNVAIPSQTAFSPKSLHILLNSEKTSDSEEIFTEVFLEFYQGDRIASEIFLPEYAAVRKTIDTLQIDSKINSQLRIDYLQYKLPEIGQAFDAVKLNMPGIADRNIISVWFGKDQ